MPRLIDISPIIDAGIAVWPGDVPFAYAKSLALRDGANLDLGAIYTTVHVGAHADARSHYVDGAATIEAHGLEPYYGPCQVIDVEVARGARILPQALGAEVHAPRVLLNTGTFPDPNDFNRDFAALSVPLVDHLAERGVTLVGIDTPSVDLFDDAQLEVHHALHARGIVNLEGLVLAHVQPGDYTLIALPLPLRGADASPVRAVLVAP